MTASPDETATLRAENDGLRARLAEAEAAIEREARARRDNEHVRNALAAGGIVGTWNWHPTRDSFTIDNGFAHAFGLDPSLVHTEVPIDQVLVNVHPDDRAGLDTAIQEAVARGGALTRTSTGSGARTVGITGSTPTDASTSVPDGRPNSFPGFVIDIDERRSLEAIAIATGSWRRSARARSGSGRSSTRSRRPSPSSRSSSTPTKTRWTTASSRRTRPSSARPGST